MKTVWKFTIPLEGAIVEMPLHAEVIHLDAASMEAINLWAIVRVPQDTESRFFSVTGTGHPVDPDLQYVGTAISQPFVWHVWESPRG